MKIISNLDKNNNHLSRLIELINTSEIIVLCSGWMKPAGVRLLKEALSQAIKISDITIYTNHAHTKSNSAALLKNIGIEKHIRITKNTIHSKFYYFETAGRYTVIIGSANITTGGLRDSDELSIETSGMINSAEHKLLTDYLNHLESYI